MNKFGTNKIAKNKNSNKISLVTDVNGIPLYVFINYGNVRDLSFVQKHINDLVILNRKSNNSNNNTILLADKVMSQKIFML
jgi:transposase